jgi:hypothetical protein
MIVSLNHREICTALVEFIGNQGYPVTDKRVEVTLTAGRGEKGHTAQIIFEDKPTPEKGDGDSDPIDPDENQQAIMFELATHDDD